MMKYKKGKNIEEELSKDNIPIECLPNDFLWMHVKGGTTVSNVIDYAKKSIDNGEYRNIVWTGSGGGISKTISCVEIMKRSYDIQQVTRLTYRKVEEYWDPIVEGLEQIVANRQIPCIHILMSLDDIDPKTLGYQNSKSKTKFWDESSATSSKKTNNNRGYNQPGGNSSGRGGRSRHGNNQNRRKPKDQKNDKTNQKELNKVQKKDNQNDENTN